jgi:hypothetical protein
MTAKDYAAMYRHVILRLSADGVDNAVNVLAYMGNEKWMAQSWWKDLYPGDDVVDWSVRNHRSKPIMLAEWGMYHRTTVKVDKAAAFSPIAAQLKAHPAVKAVVYFYTKADKSGDGVISVDSTATALAAFKKVAAEPMFRVTLR